MSESAFAPLRRAALSERARAGLAGVSRAKLVRGDSLAREAEGLAVLGRQTEAVDRLALATANWQAARAEEDSTVARRLWRARARVRRDAECWLMTPERLPWDGCVALSQLAITGSSSLSSRFAWMLSLPG